MKFPNDEGTERKEGRIVSRRAERLKVDVRRLNTEESREGTRQSYQTTPPRSLVLDDLECCTKLNNFAKRLKLFPTM